MNYPAQPFLTAGMLQQAIMSREAENRANSGYCPKCLVRSLEEVNRAAGLRFYCCLRCNATVVLGGSTPSQSPPADPPAA